MKSLTLILILITSFLSTGCDIFDSQLPEPEVICLEKAIVMDPYTGHKTVVCFKEGYKEYTGK